LRLDVTRQGGLSLRLAINTEKGEDRGGKKRRGEGIARAERSNRR